MMRIFSILFVLFVSAGCSADTRSLPEEPGNELSERFHPSGIESDKLINDFFSKIKKLVKNQDKNNLSKIISYPIKIYALDGNSRIDIINENDFINNYSLIFNERVIHTINCETFAGLGASSSGIIIGDGAMWFSEVKLKDEDPWEMKVTAINNKQKPRNLWFKNENCK